MHSSGQMLHTHRLWFWGKGVLRLTPDLYPGLFYLPGLFGEFNELVMEGSSNAFITQIFSRYELMTTMMKMKTTTVTAGLLGERVP